VPNPQRSTAARPGVDPRVRAFDQSRQQDLVAAVVATWIAAFTFAPLPAAMFIALAANVALVVWILARNSARIVAREICDQPQRVLEIGDASPNEVYVRTDARTARFRTDSPQQMLDAIAARCPNAVRVRGLLPPG
jgi:hypothetical protein